MPARARRSFDPFATLVHLGAGGRARPLRWTPRVFPRLAAAPGDRLVGAKRAVVPADFHAETWEMHPGGDELLYLLAGTVEVVLEAPGGERRFTLRGGRACLVARGVWHRLRLREPSDLLFVTPARGTRHRPVGPSPDSGRRRGGRPAALTRDD